MKRLRALLALPVALVLLHATAVVPFLPTWTKFGEALTRGSVELFVLLAMVLLAGALGRPRLGAHVATVSMLVWTVLRAALVCKPLFFETEFVFTDVQQVPALYHLLMHDEPVSRQVLHIGGYSLALVVVYLLLSWSFLQVARAASDPRLGKGIVVLLQVCVIGSVFHRSFAAAAPSIWHPSSFVILASTAWRDLAIAVDPAAANAPYLERIALAADAMERAPGDLAKLGNADVHMVFLESYGQVALRHPDLAPRLQAVWGELSLQLGVAGFQACTATVRPAIRGGASWLAHAQLLTSVRVSNQRTWELLLQSDLVPLPKRFAAAGYQTVEVMPAMDRHWPEGQAFYGFTDEVTQLELGYTGTRYHWGLMPDQFALHHLLERFVVPAKRPLFTSFVSVTSHVPFRSVPPYIADWRIDGETFAGPPHCVYDVPWTGIADPEVVVPAYLDTLEYSLRTVVGFVCRLQRPSLVVVLGDHQPPFCSSLVPSDPSFDVPMHVFSNRAELLKPLVMAGFEPGLAASPEREVLDTALFAPSFLRLYAK